jgi:protein-tyrosine-phosphatase
MAEALLMARMPESWRGEVNVSSAGTIARDGQPATPAAVDAVAELDIDLSAHRARRLDGGLVSGADLVVAMAEEHAEAVLALDPDAESKLLKLGELDPEREEDDIADPIGGDRAVYAASRDEIDRLISRLVRYISDNFNVRK